MAVDWLRALDVDRAVINCRLDSQGDWYRDPWAWAELEWMPRAGRLDLLVERLQGTGVAATERIDVPKENFARRPAIVLDPLDRLAYQALVDRASTALIGDLRPWVFGWRLVPGEKKGGQYARNDYQWSGHRRRLGWLASTYSAVLTTDVVACFGSIAVDRVCEIAESQLRASEMTARLQTLLGGWEKVAGRSGLPQRSLASCVLANRYLRPVDDILESHGRPPAAAAPNRCVRWMDDMWLFGDDAGALRAAQLDIQKALEAIALNMNFGKTIVAEGDQMTQIVAAIEHSGVDFALDKEGDQRPLELLIEEIMESPAQCSRTTIRFATTRIRRHGLFQHVDRFVEMAHHMPHAADHLGRLFRESGKWRELGEWYRDHAASPWGTFEISLANLGAMFPSNKKPPPEVAKAMESWAANPATGLPLLALSAQRLVAWTPKAVRHLLRDTAGSSDHPLKRRLFALAAAEAGEDRPLIRSLLGEFSENAPTLAMLEDCGFRPPKVARDYAGTT